MASHWMTGGIVFGLGVLLVLVEWLMARRKKEGVTWTDRRRMWGLLRVAAIVAAVAGWMAWMAS